METKSEEDDNSGSKYNDDGEECEHEEE